jgi:ABC-type multidrug transport system fused ATPase/permease subunit
MVTRALESRRTDRRLPLGGGLLAFVGLLEWQVRLLFRRAPRSAAAAIVLSGTSVLLQAGSAGALVLFIRAQQQRGSTAHLLGFDVPAHPTLGGLAAWGGVVLLLGTAAALLTHAGALRSQAAAAAGARGHVASVLAEVSRLASSHEDPLPPEVAEGRWVLIRAFVRDSAVLARSLSLTLGLFLPLFTLVLAALVLVWLDPWLALGIAMPLVLLGVPYWALNRGVVRAARSYEELARRRTILLREMFGSALEGRTSGVDREELDRRLRSDPTLRDNERAIAAFMLRGDRVQSLRIGYLGVALCGILLLFGIFQERDDSWAALATFVVALRYATASLATVGGTLVGAVRYVPQLERMRAMGGARASEDWRRLLRAWVRDGDSAADPEADELD